MEDDVDCLVLCVMCEKVDRIHVRKHVGIHSYDRHVWGVVHDLGARSRSFIFSCSAPFIGDEPTNTIAHSGHGAPAGRGRGTLSEDTVSTLVASLVFREVSWSRACLRRCRT
jgi:hypothetical protein